MKNYAMMYLCGAAFQAHALYGVFQGSFLQRQLDFRNTPRSFPSDMQLAVPLVCCV